MTPISYIPKRLIFVFLGIVAAMLVSVQATAFVVVLDAGHGGKDPGALGTYSKEKNINLNVVLRLGKMIKENCRDVTVIYTRQTDKFVELDERANIANNAKADLFISVHTNSVGNGSTSATGSETYSLSLERAAQNLDVVKRENAAIQYEENRQKYSMSSVESSIMNEIIMGSNMRTGALFAKSIQDEYVRVGRPNRGVGQAGFLVLRKTAMPSVLTELGFISTPSEEAYLNSEQGINELATCIFNAFRKHISPILRGTTTEPATPVVTAPEVSAKEEPAQETVAPQPAPAPKQQPAQKPQPAVKQQPAPAKPVATKPQPAQKPQATVAPAKPAETQPAKSTANGKYEFKVQICTSDRQLHQDSEQFKGLKDVKSYAVTAANGRRQFVHTYGNTTSYAEITAIKNKLRPKFADCFVVVFKDGQRVTGEEASMAIKKQP